jgi:diguanylate cyclase (GGDEF)-like protein
LTARDAECFRVQIPTSPLGYRFVVPDCTLRPFAGAGGANRRDSCGGERSILDIVAAVLVSGGILIQVSAAVVIRRLIWSLPSPRLRVRWRTLLGFVVIFVVGYLAYLLLFHGRHHEAAHLIVPTIFFLGACFVVLVAQLSLLTARDLGRIERLEAETITDELTGLHNRRSFNRIWKGELARAQRHRLPVSVLLVDIDHFKDINDTCGHRTGDEVLAAVGQLIVKTVRASDMSARYGGEEFAVITPHTAPTSARGLAEKLRQVVERSACTALGEQNPERKVTVSIGVAGCANAAEGCEDLFERADKALYAAKHAGRNCVIVS